MTRCSKSNTVYFWEEPIFDASTACVELRHESPRLYVAVPHLPADLEKEEEETCRVQEWLLGQLIANRNLKDLVLWYYTPMALGFSRTVECGAIVYDCMDELSAFRGAPVGLRTAEAELFRKADLVFTGGHTLFEAKKRQHPSVHCFPSSIDREFFGLARRIATDPADQADIPHPRLGYCGVIDERMDTTLLADLADARTDWHIVMVGPVVKIQDSELPRRSNLHYLGSKEYRTLPSYLAGWEVGLLPFARNESTRFISPTKTPEYLAAGLPVVSTSITDVVRPYGSEGLVYVADSCADFVTATERALQVRRSEERVARVDAYLAHMSWDQTWERMAGLIQAVIRSRNSKESSRRPELPSILGGSSAAD